MSLQKISACILGVSSLSIKLVLFIIALVFTNIHSFPIDAQVRIQSIKTIEPGLHLIYYDTSRIKALVTKSTIVEFDNYLALIELPIVYDGGGAKKKHDYAEEGEQVLAALQIRFPDKPLKYVLSSHWHPHSLGAVAPFISKGITLVTTHTNFETVREGFDSTILERFKQNICYVDKDSLVISDQHTSIVVYHLSKADYENLPTKDYLYFHLPQHNVLFSSCMYQRMSRAIVRGKELVSGRTEDLDQFITKKHLHPRKLLSFTNFDDDSSGVITTDTMQYILKNGLRTSVIINSLCDLSVESLLLRGDSIRSEMLNSRISSAYINTAVYKELGRKHLLKAHALAQLQVLMNPSDPNCWDTYGETFYFLGDQQNARYYERQSRRIDSSFTRAGEQSWKKNLEEHERRWELMR